MKENIQTALDSTLKILEDSNIESAGKVYYRNLLTSTAEGTNGLTEKEKLQNVSESVFSLTELFVRTDIERHERFKKLNAKLDGLLESMNTKLDGILDSTNKTISAKQRDIVAETTKPATPPSPRTKLEIVMDGLRFLNWWWAAATVAIVGIFAYSPQIVDAIRRLFGG